MILFNKFYNLLTKKVILIISIIVLLIGFGIGLGLGLGYKKNNENVCIFNICKSSPCAIKIACVGDSITRGVIFNDWKNDNYPAQLGKMLGSKYDVCNFGVNGSCLSRKGNRPYFITPDYVAVINQNPNMIILMLGTNDIQPQNWISQEFFINEGKWFINQLQNISSKPKIYIVIPPPIFCKNPNYPHNIELFDNQLIPAIKKIAQELNISIIDVNSQLVNKPQLFPDCIHPNPEGNKTIANIIYQELIK